MRRSVSLSILAVALLGAVACDGPYLPAGWNAPIVTSVTVSPDPVVADAVHRDGDGDRRPPGGVGGPQVSRTSPRSLGAHEGALPESDVRPPAGSDRRLQLHDADHRAQRNVDDGRDRLRRRGPVPGVRRTRGRRIRHQDFGVTGGTDDDRPPAVVSAVFAPDPIVVGSPFNVTLQVSDDHLESGLPAQILTFSGLGTGTSTQYCPESARTGLSATIDQFVFACPAPPLAGQYSLGNGFTDQIGNHYLWNPVITIGSPS